MIAIIITTCHFEIFLPYSDYIFVMNVAYSEWLFNSIIYIFNIWYKNPRQSHSQSPYPLLCSPLYYCLYYNMLINICVQFYETVMCFGALCVCPFIHDSVSGTSIIHTNNIIQCIFKVALHLRCGTLQRGGYIVGCQYWSCLWSALLCDISL